MITYIIFNIQKYIFTTVLHTLCNAVTMELVGMHEAFCCGSGSAKIRDFVETGQQQFQREHIS